MHIRLPLGIIPETIVDRSELRDISPSKPNQSHDGTTGVPRAGLALPSARRALAPPDSSAGSEVCFCTAAYSVLITGMRGFPTLGQRPCEADSVLGALDRSWVLGRFGMRLESTDARSLQWPLLDKP